MDFFINHVIWYLTFSDRFTLTPSGPAHTAVNDKISLFPMAERQSTVDAHAHLISASRPEGLSFSNSGPAACPQRLHSACLPGCPLSAATVLKPQEGGGSATRATPHPCRSWGRTHTPVCMRGPADLYDGTRNDIITGLLSCDKGLGKMDFPLTEDQFYHQKTSYFAG